MKRMLQNLVPYPVDAESDNFTAALASALIVARGYTENDPYWCADRRSYCIHCSPCGDNLSERRQLSVYHCLLTASTLAFGFDYPWDDSVEPHTLPGFKPGWRWDDDYLNALARFAGFSYLRFNGESPEKEVLGAIKNSLDIGLPSLLRLKNDIEWILAVGYDGDTLIALDSKIYPLHDSRLSELQDAVVITGNITPEMSYKELLERIVSALSYGVRNELEKEIFDALDNVTPENAMDVAGMMCAINGVTIETRWHAAEAFRGNGNLLCDIFTDKELLGRLGNVFFERYIKENNDETHGLGWKIWSALGVSGETGYNITPQSATLILQKETREKLKTMYSKIFENDREVCKAIREVLINEKGHEN